MQGQRICGALSAAARFPASGQSSPRPPPTHTHTHTHLFCGEVQLLCQPDTDELCLRAAIPRQQPLITLKAKVPGRFCGAAAISFSRTSGYCTMPAALRSPP